MNREMLKSLFVAVYNAQLRMVTATLKRLPDDYELPDFIETYNRSMTNDVKE